MLKLKLNLIFSVIVVASVHVCAGPRLRPADWATPVIGSELKNFYKVSEKVYRSEQPDSKTFRDVRSLRITSVLNLRNHHTDDDEAENSNLTLYAVKINAGSITPEQVYQALAVIKKSKGPILIHCWHGSDRTGAVVAAYRMVFQNWSKVKAIDEFKNGGYGYHARWYPNIIKLLNNLNIPKLKSKLRLKS